MDQRAPSIVADIAWVPRWFKVDLTSQALILLTLTAALAWSASCWLVASALKDVAPKRAKALIAVTTAALLLGLAVDSLFRADAYWIRRIAWVIHLLDPAAGVLLVLLLRTAAPRVADPTLKSMLTPLTWLCVARAGEAVELIAPESRYSVHFLINTCAAASGLLFAIVMLQLRLASASAGLGDR